MKSQTHVNIHRARRLAAELKARGIQPKCRECRRPCKVFLPTAPGPSRFICFDVLPIKGKK